MILLFFQLLVSEKVVFSKIWAQKNRKKIQYYSTAKKLRLALAVLHPRRLVVYQVAAMGGSGKSATYYSVVKAYEHNFDDAIKHFTASNMIWGSFGLPTRTKELICVQSMDGRLQFYEQDHYAFTTQLSNCLVPGPICYCESSDILVTCNSKREIVAYKYGLLASSCTRKNYNRNIDWSINIGEHALDIYVSRYSKQKGTHDIFGLKHKKLVD